MAVYSLGFSEIKSRIAALVASCMSATVNCCIAKSDQGKFGVAPLSTGGKILNSSSQNFIPRTHSFTDAGPAVSGR